MATYSLTGTTGNDTKSFSNVGGQPSSGNTYNIDLLAGTDTFRFDEGTTGKYIGRFLSTGFTIGAAVNGVITVTGASTGGSRFTFNFTSVENLVFGDKTVTLSYTPADTTPPTASTFTPSDTATAVGETSDIVVTFSEAIQKGTGTIEIRSVSATGTIFESYNAATSTNVTVSGSTLTINPTGTLLSNTKYYVLLPSGSVKDLAGNSYAGTSAYSFTTGDTISPVFSSGATGSVDENAAISTVVYTAVATDAGGSTVTYSLSGTDAASFNINATTGAVTLKASADYETKTSYSFNVVASDGITAHNATKAVVVSVNNLNDNAPVFTSGATGSVDENAAISTVVYTAAATDADNLGALTYSLSGTDASLLNIDSATGAVTLKASADYETKASYSFDVKVSDGLAAHDVTKAVVVSVNNLNDNAPVFTSGSTGSVDENAPTTTVIYTAAATDADNLGALTYSLSGTDAAALNIDSATGAVTLKASADYETKSSYSFSVTSSDGLAVHDVTKAVTVSVNNLNDNAPVFTSGSKGVVVNDNPAGTLAYTAIATDADGNPLVYSLTGTDAALFNIDSANGQVTLKSPASYAAKQSYSFNAVVSDGLNTISKAVTIIVQPVNDVPPVFSSGATGSVDENAATSTVVYTAVATDGDGNPLSYSLSGTDAALLNIDSDTGAVTLKTSADYETKSSYSFNVMVSDGLEVNDATKAVTVTVNNLNDNAPVFTSGGTGVVVDKAPAGTVVYTAAATDADGDKLTFTLGGTDASLLNIDAATGEVTLQTAADYQTKSSYSFDVTASDGLSAHDTTRSVSLTVQNSYTLDEVVKFWKGLTPVAGATESIKQQSVALDTLTSGVDGILSFQNVRPGTYDMTVTKAVDTSTSRAVSSSDALAALKIAVGINPNGDGTAVSNYQYLAADVNKDGKITSTDALSILKMAVHLTTAPSQEWLFVQKSVESVQMSKTSIDWSAVSLQMNVTGDQHVDLVGIVKGDVNGNWAP